MEATLCFVDLAGLTALTEAHRADAAADLTARFGSTVDASLEGDASVVDRIGDAVDARPTQESSTLPREGATKARLDMARDSRKSRLPASAQLNARQGVTLRSNASRPCDSEHTVAPRSP